MENPRTAPRICACVMSMLTSLSVLATTSQPPVPIARVISDYPVVAELVVNGGELLLSDAGEVCGVVHRVTELERLRGNRSGPIRIFFSSEGLKIGETYLVFLTDEHLFFADPSRRVPDVKARSFIKSCSTKLKGMSIDLATKQRPAILRVTSSTLGSGVWLEYDATRFSLPQSDGDSGVETIRYCASEQSGCRVVRLRHLIPKKEFNEILLGHDDNH